MRAKTNLFIDVLLFVLFLIVYEVNATGSTIHEWLSILLGILFIVHIILHWKWIKACSRQIFNRIKGTARINYILSILIYFGFTTIMFSGLMISESFMPFFGFREGHSRYWQEVHFVSVDVTLFFVAVHVAMHWKWIVKNFKRYILHPFKTQLNSERKQEKVIPNPVKPVSWKLSDLTRSGYQALLILAISGFISLGWYAFAGPNSSETYARGFRQGNGRNFESRAHNENLGRLERFEGRGRGRHNGRGRGGEGRHLREREHHQENEAFGLETLKNLMIFSLIILLVTLLTNIFKRRKAAGLPTNS